MNYTSPMHVRYESGASSPLSDDSGVVLTPARVTRTRSLERKELAGLNDRLASYIERVRHLQAENNQLKRRLDEERRSSGDAVANVKSLYDREVENLRISLDHEAKQRGQLQIEVNVLEQHRNELSSKVDVQKKGLDQASKRAADQKNKIICLQKRLDEQMRCGNIMREKIKKADEQIKSLQSGIQVITTRSEKNALEKVDLQNKCTTLAEELEFKTKLFKNQLEQLTEQHHQRENQQRETLQLENQHGQQLINTLADLRKEYQEFIGQNRREIEARYQKQLVKLKETVATQKKTQTNLDGQLQERESSLQRLEKQISDLKNDIVKSTDHSNSLRKQLSDEREYLTRQLSGKNDQLLKLEASSCQQLQDYAKLLDVKVLLDAEIATYRELLNMEENRLKLPGKNVEAKLSAQSHHQSFASDSKTRLVGDQRGRGQMIGYQRTGGQTMVDHKVLGQVVGEGQTGPEHRRGIAQKRSRRCRSNSPMAVSCYRKLSINECHSALELSANETRVCKFVSILNKSDQPINLSGLRLTRYSPGSDRTMEFHFPDELEPLSPGEQSRVWSPEGAAIAKITARAPHELVLAEHPWPVDSNVITTLYDKQKVLAKLVMNRTSQIKFYPEV